MNIFELLYEDFKFDKNKPINLFEAFSGIGTQAMALKRLGLKVNHVGISEVDRHAIKSYEAIHGKVKNYGGVGSFEKFPPNIDICTWSFPCQDISLAGTQSGMVAGSRSNYGYVFLDTIENTPYHERPKVLLMENVKALLSEKFSEDWKEINLRLERLGYKNYADSLIATDYGIPQTRDRVFIVSIKGDYNYNFPKPFELTTRLKDYLEDEVDEKYYLSDKMIDYLTNDNTKNYNRKEVFMRNFDENKDVASTITTLAGNRATDNFLLIKEATKKGYAEATDGDGVYINRPHQKRGVVQKDKIQTIKTQTNDIGVVVKNKKEQLVDELLKNNIVKDGDIINHSYTTSNVRQELKDYIETDNGLSPTLTTRPDILGVVVKDTPNYIEHESLGSIDNTRRAWKEEKVMGTISTNKDTSKVLLDNPLRIRKLTPLECWRLMGIDDDDFYKAQRAGVSDSQLYKQAGNAIVVDVLYYIFKEMF